ncbi:MAG: DUF4173 domain-containing protein, partial [Proteobacteria bacterium]|nr:DUF4173 domain-containing protein [Pseudomonadota bacterium]
MQSTFSLAESVPGRTLRQARSAWLVALTAGLGAALFVYDAPIGLNWTLLLWLLAGAAALLDERGRASLRRPALAASAALALPLSLSGDPVLQLPLALASLWCGSIALATTARPLPGAGLLLAPARACATALAECARRAAEASRLAGSAAPTVRGLVVALPVVALFWLLLASADPTFDAWRRAGVAWLASWSFAGQTGVFLTVAAFALGVCGTMLRETPPAPARAARSASARFLGQVEAQVVLAAVVALLALYFALQLSYLFGNPGARGGSGVTLADAVHRGFRELTLVATLSGALTVTLDRHTGGLPARARLLAALLLAGCLLLLDSSWVRLVAYDAGYGYTRLRLYVAAYMVVAAVALLCLALELRAAID